MGTKFLNHMGTQFNVPTVEQAVSILEKETGIERVSEFGELPDMFRCATGAFGQNPVNISHDEVLVIYFFIILGSVRIDLKLSVNCSII